MNYSSSDFDNNAMLSMVQKMNAAMQSNLIVFITTPRTLVLLLKAVKEQEQKHFAGAVPGDYLRLLSSIRVEEYATVKECLDRMMDQREGERLKLILSENIPVDCIDHPWIRNQVQEMAKSMGFV